MQRPSVDLPHPDSPTSPSASPRRISRSTPSTARSTSRSLPPKRSNREPPRGKCLCRPLACSNASATALPIYHDRILARGPCAGVVVYAGRSPPVGQREQRELTGNAVVFYEGATRVEGAPGW